MEPLAGPNQKSTVARRITPSNMRMGYFNPTLEIQCLTSHPECKTSFLRRI